jgi:enterobacterial common antigen flippase
MASGVVNGELPADPTQVCPEQEQSHKSYGQILKSSALIGGSSVINVAIGIVRTKAMAMLLGPSGFGLAGLYSSVAELTQNVAGMGVNSSGVRQIAEAVGSEDEGRIAQTVAVLRRTSLVLGVVGAFVLIIFSRQISLLTFGTTKNAFGICLVSLVVLFKSISGGQGALIQGMRRIGDLARMSVYGALLSTLIGIPLVYFLREDGVVPYLICVAAMTVLASWWYSRKLKINTPKVKWVEVRDEAGALLKLGFAFMTSGLMTMGVAYAIRVILLHKQGIQATGLYQSAWTLGGLYVTFILQAMGADFYPRLTANINDHKTSNRLVNEQARVGLLLAGPGVLATLTFAPLVVALLYSGKFAGSVPILRWVCLGALLQVISWPMGFIIVAKGKQNLFIFSEVAWAVASLGLSWACISYFGVVGAGIAFFASYVFHVFLTYAIVSRVSGFRWSADNIRTSSLFLGVIAAVFCGLNMLPLYLAASIGAIAAVATGSYSAWVFSKLLSIDELPRPLRRIITAIRAMLSRPASAN